MLLVAALLLLSYREPAGAYRTERAQFRELVSFLHSSAQTPIIGKS